MIADAWNDEKRVVWGSQGDLQPKAEGVESLWADPQGRCAKGPWWGPCGLAPGSPWGLHWVRRSPQTFHARARIAENQRGLSGRFLRYCRFLSAHPTNLSAQPCLNKATGAAPDLSWSR